MAAQAAAAARGLAPSAPRQGGGEAGGQRAAAEEARAAAAREELERVNAEAARVREATTRTLGDCAYILQVQMDKVVDEIGADGSAEGFFASQIRPYLARSPGAAAAQDGAALPPPPSPADGLADVGGDGTDSEVDLEI